MFPGLTMANFGGHAIPGSFFLLFGFWLTLKCTLQHVWRTSQPKGRHNLPPFFKKMEYVEGGLQIFASFVGQFSFRSICTLQLFKHVLGFTCLSRVTGIMVEQFVVDGPHARLYDKENNSWVKLMNWQHGTMYLFFGISGIARIASAAFKVLPAGVDRLTISVALFVEGNLQTKINKKLYISLTHHKCGPSALFCV